MEKQRHIVLDKESKRWSGGTDYHQEVAGKTVQDR